MRIFIKSIFVVLISTIYACSPSEMKNPTKQSNLLWEGQLKASFRNILAQYKNVFVISKI
jgi:hypothetical protein